MAGPVARYTQQGLQPAYSPQLVSTRNVSLPYGGPTDGAAYYAQGLILSNDPSAARAEQWTFTASGNSGTFTIYFKGGAGILDSGALAYNVSTADFKTGLENIFGEGSIATVTGTAGTSYVATFAWNARIGGTVTFSNTFGSGSISLSRSVRGSVGAGQYDVYDSSTYTTTDAILEYKTLLDPTGALVGEFITSTGQPFAPQAYLEGFFFVFTGEDGSDTTVLNIPNIDSDAVGASGGGKLKLVLGTIAEAGAVVRLTQ